MTETRNGAKYIDRNPPLVSDADLDRKVVDYLAYLKEILNFSFATNGKRLTDVNGNVNELSRTAGELVNTIYNTETGLVTQVSQQAGEITLMASKLDNIGGRNILLNSATLQWSVLNGATVTHTTGQSVTEWLCNDAIRAVGNCGNVNGVCLQMYLTSQTSNVYLADTHYIMSCYIKNNHATKSLWLAANNGTSEEIAPGEAKRAVAEVDGDGYTALRMRIYVARTGDPFDFTYWHPQIECGEVLTAWSPAPEDKVGNNEIISKINVSPEAIQIEANKISLAGKTIDLTSDTITIQSTNFSVTPAGIITATGVNLTGTFNITGGSVNIHTSAETNDVIELSANIQQTTAVPVSGTVSARIEPTLFKVFRDATYYSNPLEHPEGKKEETTAILSAESGTPAVGLYVVNYDYDGNISRRRKTNIINGSFFVSDAFWSGGSQTSLNSAELQPNLLTISQGTVYTELDYSGLDVYWSNDLMANLGKDALTFYNSSGTVTARYPNYGLYAQDIGSRNLCVPLTSGSKNSVTFTFNSDDSVSMSGSASAWTFYPVSTVNLVGGVSYTLTGATGGSSSLYLNLIPSGGGSDVANDLGSGATFTPSTSGEYSLRIIVTSGTSTNKTFYPMIRPASITDSTFVPWVRTQKEQDQALANLTLQSFSSKNIDDEQWRQGDWNNTTSSTRVSQVNTSRPFLKGGVSYTVTNSGYASYQWTSAFLATQQATTYIGGTSWTGDQSYTFTPAQDCYIAVIWRNNASTAITPSEIATNCKFMIRETKNTDDTYVPLVKTAEQLTTMRPFEMADCFHQYIQVAGSISFTLKQGVYLVTIGKYSTTDANTNGLYVMTVYNSSSIYTIKSSSAASVSVSGYTVSVTSSQNYVEVSAIKVA